MTSSLLASNSPPSPATATQLRLKDILKTLPREVFQKNRRKAWSTVLISVSAAALGYLGIAVAPWFLLPLFWIFTGTVLTGFFVIGHDCGHRSFAKHRWVNDWVGHIFMLPLIYPFHAWRLQHNLHHAHTNKMDVDNAWQPARPELYDSLSPQLQEGYRLMRGRLWWLASIVHWAGIHFDWNKFSGKDRTRVKVSVLAVLGFAAIVFPLLIVTTGVWGFVKFWLMPWLVYHFWMSTFTLVHHTESGIQFRPASEWNEAEAQLFGTVHCEYPAWVEFVCHHINVHIPHHLSTAIPSYNLRMAYASLQQNWPGELNECRFSWETMQGIIGECHIYEPEQCYTSFREHHQSAGK